MGDSAELYRSMREHRTAMNAKRYERNYALLAKLPESHPDVQVLQLNNGMQWRVVAHGLVVDYWPSTGRFRELHGNGELMQRDSILIVLQWMQRAAEGRRRQTEYARRNPTP